MAFMAKLTFQIDVPYGKSISAMYTAVYFSDTGADVKHICSTLQRQNVLTRRRLIQRPVVIGHLAGMKERNRFMREALLILLTENSRFSFINSSLHTYV